MKLEALCTMELQYSGDFHLARPYGNESGSGWGIGRGTVTGERLSGQAQWSNHPRRRGDGIMLPSARGVIATGDGAEVVFDLTGRTVFLDVDGTTVGRQLLMTLFESEAADYAWLNDVVCMTEGAIDPEKLSTHLEVHLCRSELA